MFNLERNKLRKEGPVKEQFDCGNNKINISYTGYERIDDLFYAQKLRGVEITITDKESDNKFNLGSLLPKGWHFCKMDKNEQVLPSGLSFFNSYLSKKICFFDSYFDLNSGKIIETLSQPEALFVLLHEIGHSFENKGVVKKRAAIKEKMRAKLRTEMLKSAAKKTKETDIPIDIFAEEEKQDYYRDVIISERRAWGYALWEYRRLKKEGINIFPEGVSNQEILKIVRHHLSLSLDARIGLMKSDDSETIKIKKRVVKENKRSKSTWKNFKDELITKILEKFMKA